AGGGGGGRIAMYYTTDSSTVTYQNYGGKNSTFTSRMGGAGTIYKKSAAQTNGDLLVDNNDQDSWDYRYYGTTPIDETIVFDTLTIQNYGHLRIASSADITYTTLDWATKGVIHDDGGVFDLVSGGGSLAISATTRLYENVVRTYTDITVDGQLILSNYDMTTNKLAVSGNVTITTTGILYHFSNSTAETHVINLEAANLTVEAGGTINLDSKGYSGGYGPGAGVSTGGNHYDAGGGSYGGKGGQGVHTSAGSTYGSITVPVNIGSGGGNSTFITSTRGGYGGGAVRLNISGTTTIDGSITTNGGTGGGTDESSGGGSGGSVYITTDTLLGAGSIIANGGISSGGSAGGGGGGRIAMYYTTDSSTVTYQNYGGKNSTSTSRMGGAGTIYKKSAA
ncbi:MAG: hypothetical protein KAI72_03930, partial [Candidatus Pacebacteria bacterium]|nr:hypothetical protein [Candidatus Paceibacterota bacterium]